MQNVDLSLWTPTGPPFGYYVDLSWTPLWTRFLELIWTRYLFSEFMDVDPVSVYKHAI